MKRKIYVSVLATLVVVGLLGGMLTGCGRQANPPEPPAQDGGVFQIKGSDSEVNVVQALVEEFVKVNNVAEFAVTGGGSGAGIAALINGQTDIANSSRPLRAEEIAQAKANAVNPVPVVFALDGLAVIVHANNAVENLTLAQVGQIFSGEITNWKEVGGADSPITLYGRQSNSGTYVFFRDRVLGKDYSQAKLNLPGNAQIVEAVRADESGIGYAAVGFVREAAGLRALSLAENPGSPFVSPLDDEKVLGGQYPLTRPLYQFLNGVPSGALRQFIEFELSPAGQEIVAREGFLPVTPEYRQQNDQHLKQ
ncbi:MAG: PstS family phosphate ABC transporter substrate-binding protein [Dethiobacter sp.]|nr:PstS family phosphate ABC transporter substrate-binding protein [Dethiobacter sp.]MCL5981966.1 PstS family phosphate ABC transporter substrate-binding protein [Bacillota bacterium]